MGGGDATLSIILSTIVSCGQGIGKGRDMIMEGRDTVRWNGIKSVMKLGHICADDDEGASYGDASEVQQLPRSHGS